jgi:hypothetical protein
MVHILNSDRWLGYAALICAVTVFLALRMMTPDAMAPVFIYVCLGPLGLYLAFRGVFVGRVTSRGCAGIALAYLGWLLYSQIYTLATVKSH